MFSFKKAQRYEFTAAKSWLKKNFKIMMADIDRRRKGNLIEPVYLDLFFQNDVRKFLAFTAAVEDKSCLEISSGPCGVFPFWGNWLSGRKFIIDPLINKYEDYICRKFGRSWFGVEVTMINSGAEIRIPELINQIEGFIMWRNGIDHFAEHKPALQNMSDYAKPGCLLFFWADIKHIEKPDAGHIEKVADNADEFENTLTELGWKINYRTPSIRDNQKYLDYGCVATKKIDHELL